MTGTFFNKNRKRAFFPFVFTSDGLGWALVFYEKSSFFCVENWWVSLCVEIMKNFDKIPKFSVVF